MSLSSTAPSRKYTPVVVVDLCLRAQKLLLTRLLGPVPSDQIAVLLGLQHGDQVDARPHLLARELAGLLSALLYSFEPKSCSLSIPARNPSH